MAALKIREALPCDASAICAISNALIRGSLVTFTTLERSIEVTQQTIRSANGTFLVAEEAGTVVGFASYAPFRAGPGYVHTKEHSIQLAAQARGRGIGRALMQQLEEVARANDVHVLVAGISSANPAGVAFHARLGFEAVGRLPETGRKNGQWLDLVLMQKILRSGNDFRGADR
ncbi:MAG: N-acetyltransferase family protein [Aestuariivita sp.]|uniref:GNAT family N-acetyltransferase n=1 Tax=Aestuariivita sp. TaxID=1872407 RepID=UPI003BAE351B